MDFVCGKLQPCTKINESTKLGYGPRVIPLLGGAYCVYSRGSRGFDGVRKITAFPSRGGGGNAYSPSPNVVGHSAVTELAFLFNANTIYNLEHLFNTWDILFKWEINIVKSHG